MKNLIKLAVTLSLAAACTPSGNWADSGAVGSRTSEAVTAASAVKPPAPEPTQAPKKEEKPRVVDLDSKVVVKRLVISRGVKGREPVEPTERFVEGEAERIYAFVELANPESAESAIFVSFVPEKGAERGPIELAVGPSARWRTWAYTRAAKTPGVWHAIVRNAKGEEIGRTRFEIGKKDAPVADPA
jgi:hypothetical protein